MHKLHFYANKFASEPTSSCDIPHGVELGAWLAENIDGFDPDNTNITYSVPFDFKVIGDATATVEPKGDLFNTIHNISIAPDFIGKALGIVKKREAKLPSAPTAPGKGSDIELSAVTGNSAKYGSPVREIFGKMKIYPDYLTMPHRYFENLRDHWTEFLGCVGIGSHDVPLSEVRLGNTPIAAYGDRAEVRVFQPGENVSVSSTSAWWHSVPEVGATSNGKSGLPLRPSYIAESTGPIGSKTFSATTITSHSDPFPADWTTGMKLSVTNYRSYTISGNRISGPLSGLSLSSGDSVELAGDATGTYIVDAVSTGAPPSDGTPSILTGASAMAYSYALTPATFSVTCGFSSAVFTLDAVYADAVAVVAALNAQVANTSLATLVVFSHAANKLVITEKPIYEARRISVQNISNGASVFGDITATNNAAVIGNAAQLATLSSFTLLDFAYASQVAVMSIKKTGEYFELTNNAGTVITVQRRKANGDLDWSGFTDSFMLSDSSVDLLDAEVEGGWQGWFDAQPDAETITEIEFDIMFPQGLQSSDKKGRTYSVTVPITYQWREKGSAVINTLSKSYTYLSIDQMAITEKVTGLNGRYEVRVKRNNGESSSSNLTNKAELFGIKSKIVGAPISYPLFTTIAIRIKGSEAASAESESMISVLATRKLNGVITRRLSDAVRYIGQTQEIDEDELNRLESIWTGRGESFDYAFEKTSTIKQALNTALGAGFAEFSLKNGRVFPYHDIKRLPNSYNHVYSAQVCTSPIERKVKMIGLDEIDGYDVSYMDEVSWRIETVKCRLPNVNHKKIVKITADGIINRDRAYRYGMRELMKSRYQRSEISTSTEMDALNSKYGDYVAFVDDVPSYGQSMLLASIAGDTVTVTEPLDWSQSGQFIAAMRKPDGTLSNIVNIERISDKSFKMIGTINFTPKPIETHVYFGTTAKMIRGAIIDSIKPSSKTAKISAVNYTDLIYDYDNAQADN